MVCSENQSNLVTINARRDSTPSQAPDGHFKEIRMSNNKSSTEISVNNVTEILQHRISWFLRDDKAPEELDESSVEHIERLIKDGYNQGELCVIGDDGNTEYRGWWSIEAA